MPLSTLKTLWKEKCAELYEMKREIDRREGTDELPPQSVDFESYITK